MNYKHFFDKHSILLALSFLFIFLIFGTGLQGDDYSAVRNLHINDLNYYFSFSPKEKGQFFFAITSWYLYFWTYLVFNENFILGYDIVKVLLNLLIFYFLYKFCSLYFCKTKSILFSLTFILFPTHDSTVFWLMTIKHVLGPSALLYLYYLVEKKSNVFLSLPILMANFVSYSTPPFAAALSMSFLLNKKFKKFFIFSLPSLIYFFVYIYFHLFTELEVRIENDLNLIFLLKNFLLQILSLLDSFFGPSFFIKIYLSIKELNFTSFLVLLLFFPLMFFFWKSLSQKKTSKNLNIKSIVIIGLLVAFFSVLMFSLTGKYNHSPFNLVNRTTIYFSFLVSVFLTATLNKKNLYLFFIFIILLPIFGLSNHWKNTNSKQKIYYQNIEQNVELQSIKDRNAILVTKGFNYSKLGNFSHIEVFAQPWHLESIFRAKTNFKKIVSITDNLKTSKEEIYNDKFSIKYSYYKLDIFLYDIQQDEVKKIDINKLNNHIYEKQKNLRHWIQLPYISKFVEDYIIYLSPRLNYLFL